MKNFSMALLYVLLIINISLFASDKTNGEDASALSRGSVSGHVTDKDGKALSGVNVYLQNTTLGIATDAEGTFSLDNVPVGQYKLIASMVGYEPAKKDLEVKEGQEEHMELSLRATFYETSSVVVTGTASQYLYADSPVKTEVVPRKLIEQTKAFNLAEAIGWQTGVRVENDCQNCNFTQVRLMGFDGKYSQILIDGDPVVNSLAGVYALEQFPQEMISQLEVVKGGGSSLYGSGAIAGTINIITRQPLTNQAKVSFQSQSLDGQLDNQLSTVAGIVSDDGNTGAFIYGSARKRNGYDRNGDGYTELGRISTETIGFNWFYKPAVNDQLSISLRRIHDDRRGGNDLDLPKHEADIAEATEHWRWGGKAKWQHNVTSKFDYSVYYSFSSHHRDSYYGGLSDEDGDGAISDQERLDALDYYGNAQSFTQVTGGRANLTYGSQRFTGGIEYYSDDLKDHSVKDERYYVDEVYTNYAAYLQDDISLLDNKLDIIAGGRLDKHSELSDAIFSPRVNLKYEVVHDLALRASFSTGFRAPQTFDEDLHVESLGGDQRVVRNADNLKQESSKSYTLGFEYEGFVHNIPVLFGVTGFYTKLNDAFTEESLGEESDGIIVWQRINSDGAEAKGVEVDFGVKPVTKLEFRGGFTYKEGKYDSPQEVFDGQFSDKFMRTPDIYGHMQISYDPVERVNVFSALRYTGKMTVPNEETETINNPDQTFWEFDLGMSYKVPFFDKFGGKINFGMKNIFDAYQKDLGVGPDRDSGYVYGPQLPRRLYFGIEAAI